MANAGERSDTVAAVILAGGRSRRFGRDKTREVVGGTAVLERVIAVARPLVDEVLVVGSWAPDGVRHVLEPDPGHGPLAGIAFGLTQVSTPHALVLAGDHPLLVPALLADLISRRPGADAVVPMGPHGPEPLVGRYRASLAGVATDLVAAGQGSVKGFLATIDTEWIDEIEWRTFDPAGHSFLDIDTVDDLAAVEAVIGGR